MSGRYVASSTKISEQSARNLVSLGIANEWVNPRTGKTRYYIGESGLARIIGLKTSWYKSGHCSGCSYVGPDGETVTVAHHRAYSDAWSKCFIEDGTVMTTWKPYGENIAELVAKRIEEGVE